MRKLLSRLLHFSIVWHLAAHGWRLLWDSPEGDSIGTVPVSCHKRHSSPKSACTSCA